MKRLTVVLAALLACCHAPRAVEIAAPPATPPPARIEVEAPLPAHAMLAPSTADGAWAAGFPRAGGFASIDLPRSSRVLVEWRVAAGHKVKDLPPEEDYPANYVAPVELVVRSLGVDRTIGLGERAGYPVPYEQSYCVHAGATMPSPSYAIPPNPSVASWFSVGMIQGSSQFLLVRDGDVIHVLHRETSDGTCTEIEQGPLDGCEGFELERIAEIHGTRDARLFEVVINDSKTLDCGVER